MVKNVYALNAVNFGHKKGEGMKGRKRNISNVASALSAQEGGIQACHLVLIIEYGRIYKNGNGEIQGYSRL